MATACSDNKNGFVILRSVTKNYDSFRALNDVSFEINEGEVFGYIGPNGAGKTTTMKIVVGLISDFQGEVLIGGCQVPRQKNEAHKHLGYLPQSVAFQEWRTVNQALRTFGKLSGLEYPKLDKRIGEVLDLLALSDVQHKKISQLSGGMTQKVGLAQALLHEPKLLVLDEPLGGLDPLSRRQFKEVIKELAKDGATVLFSSHILSDVEGIADRVGILNKGQIKRVGTLEQLQSSFTSQRIIEVQFSGGGEKWQSLTAIQGVKDVAQRSQGKILVTLAEEADSDQVINSVVQTLVKLNGRIRSIMLLSPTLDEIYAQYVSEDENA